jgi:sn-glycerol 3-phosphate transport system permease protein
VVVIAGIALVCFPVYVTFVASSLTAEEVLQSPMTLIPGAHLVENYRIALFKGVGESAVPVGLMLFNSLVLALGVALGKILVSIISAYAVVYFRFPLRKLAFWAIFITLMLPVEVRIMPTYKVVSDLGLINTRSGMILPIVASATATFLFRQMFLTVPEELTEAARVDGAGPMQFFWNILLPLSTTTIAALFVIQFIYGWNQYLWPLLVTTNENMYPVVIGIKHMISGGEAANDWNLVMATAMLAMLPPAIVVLLMQRWFVKGLVDTEK